MTTAPASAASHKAQIPQSWAGRRKSQIGEEGEEMSDIRIG